MKRPLQLPSLKDAVAGRGSCRWGGAPPSCPVHRLSQGLLAQQTRGQEAGLRQQEFAFRENWVGFLDLLWPDFFKVGGDNNESKAGKKHHRFTVVLSAFHFGSNYFQSPFGFPSASLDSIWTTRWLSTNLRSMKPLDSILLKRGSLPSVRIVQVRFRQNTINHWVH